MLKTIWKWIKWMQEFTKELILAAAGLAVSGVLGYFVIRFLLKQLWNVSDDISDNIGDLMDE